MKTVNEVNEMTNMQTMLDMALNDGWRHTVNDAMLTILQTMENPNLTDDEKRTDVINHFDSIIEVYKEELIEEIESAGVIASRLDLERGLLNGTH